MKTAFEIFRKHWKNHKADKELLLSTADQNMIESAMEEYASQFKYDYSQECKCGEDSTGSTWCCNICGLPVTKKKEKVKEFCNHVWEKWHNWKRCKKCNETIM